MHLSQAGKKSGIGDGNLEILIPYTLHAFGGGGGKRDTECVMNAVKSNSKQMQEHILLS